jgi:hypothetical protein
VIGVVIGADGTFALIEAFGKSPERKGKILDVDKSLACPSWANRLLWRAYRKRIQALPGCISNLIETLEIDELDQRLDRY